MDKNSFARNVFVFPTLLLMGLFLFLPEGFAQAAFPSIAATNNGNSGGSITSHTVNLPSGISSGHLLVVFFSNDGNATVSWPSGWTSLFSTVNGTANHLSAAYRVADGSEGATITVTTSASEGSAHTSYRITGQHSSTAPVAGTAATGSSTAPDPPSLSPSWGAEDTLWLAGYGWDSNATNSSYPANYSLGQATDLYNQTVHGAGVASAGRQLNASSENPGTAGLSTTEAWVANTIAIRPFAASTITLSTGTDPASATVAPGASIQDAGAFSLQSDGSSDSVSALTVTLAGSGTPYSGVSEVRVTSDDGSATYFSAVSNPSSNTVNFSGGTAIPVTTSLVQFKIRITPRTHANMPAVPGAEYSLSPYVSDWTLSGGNTKAGSDSNSNTLTIDNLSPNSATSPSGTGGTSSVALSWTTSSSTDFSRSVVLRWASSSAGSDVPAEGTDYTISDSIGSAEVVCVRTADSSSASITDAEDGAGTGGCRSTPLSAGTYSYKVFQKDSNGNYDAGATFTNSPFTIASTAIKYVFYSVGQSTADLKTCTDNDCVTNPLTVTLSSGEATFSVAQTGNIGVGDAVTYDTNQVCYISSKTSTSVWNCVSATGTAPADITDSTVVSIKRVFTTLSGAEDGAPALIGTSDLVTGNYQLNFPCYYDTGADTTAVTIDGWTTGVPNYIKVYTPNDTDSEANFSQRHEGKWDEGKYRLGTPGSSGDNSITINANYCYLDGLQVYKEKTTYSAGSSILIGVAAAGDVRVANSIIKAIQTLDGYSTMGIAISITGSHTKTFKIWNNIFYGFKDPSNANGHAIYTSTDGTMYLYNNTILDSYWGFRDYYNGDYLNVMVKNNISYNNAIDYYSGTYNAASSHNLTASTTDGAFGATHSTGTTTATTANKLTDSGATFISDGVQTGSIVKNTTDTTYSYVISVDSETELTLNDDIFSSGEGYSVYTNMYGEAVFEDGDNDDFRLSPDDTTAKDNGIDLSADANLAFDYDIASNTRPTGDGWDIGAHEAATRIYRSVGPSATAAVDDYNTASSTLTIASSTAVFSAATADNIGVGDVLLYDADGDNDLDGDDSIYFIHARASSTEYTLRDQSGLAITATTTANDRWAVYRAHTSLADAEAGTVNSTLSALGFSFSGGDRDLVSNNEQWNIACYANGTTADGSSVNIADWITADVNYLKFYTPVLASEVGTSQRHSGKWNEEKYWITGYTSNFSIDYIKVDGLQIKRSASSGTSRCFYSYALTSGANLIEFSNNILVGEYSGTAVISGFSSGGSNNIVYVWNNLVYGFNDVGIGSAGEMIAYNNTVLNISSYGFRNLGTAIAKNNISYNNTTDYSGTFHASSTHNLSSDNTAPAYGTYYRNATVEFVDAAGGDYRLAPTDTAARNMGADLSADANLSFSTDILGNTRPAGDGWDIGAHEAAERIFRSVGPSATSALDTGSADSNELTIASSTATFSIAVPASVGVGDAIQYDSTGDGTVDSIAFIHARASSTSYTLKKADGSAPADMATADTDWSIFRSYISLANAEKGVENTGIASALRNFDDWTAGGDATTDDVGRDLVANNEQWNIACYANGTTADTTAVGIGGWTTDAPNYLKIYTPVGVNEVGTSQRHGGKWDEGKYYIQVSNTWGIYVQDVNTYLDGLQVQAVSGNTVGLYIAESENIKISNLILDKNKIGTYAIRIGNTSGLVNIWNSIIYGVSVIDETSARGISTNSTTNIYNTTVIGGYYGIYRSGGTLNCKNVYAGGSYSADFTGATKTSCASSDTTGSDGLQNIAVDATNFITISEGTEDFHLPIASVLRDAGTDLSADPVLSFSTDIDGHTRSTTTHSGAWDIGADESATAVYYSTGQSADDLSTSSPTVSISSGTAVFSAAQTGNIGVGDVITYDTDQACYISGKVSSTTWTCLTATGTIPADITDSSVAHIKRAFSSLSGAESGSETLLGTADLASDNLQLNLPCYYDSGADETSVWIDGWTTGVPNYIKVYTPNDTEAEANFSQRHEGVWDEGKYSVQTTASWVSSFLVRAQYSIIEGLQVAKVSGEGPNPILSLDLNSPFSHYSQLRSNIVKQIGGESVPGIRARATEPKIYNNIVYDCSTCFSNWYSSNAIYYNNAALNCGTGFVNVQYTGYFKNNISKSDIDFNNSLGTLNGNYNASADGTADDFGGSGNLADKTFSFVDEENDDFRLSDSDTSGAIDGGADLSADTNFAFSTDIIANPRPAGAGWDIGAFEAPAKIYRSVGPGATDALDNDNSHADTITLSSGTATFSAAVADNVGVGDVVVIDTGGTDQTIDSADTLLFISGRTSSTGYTLQTETGALPSDIALNDTWAIYRAHTSLSNAEAGTVNSTLSSLGFSFSGGDRDLVSNNEQWNIACYANGTTADTTSVTVAGWTTDAPNYLKIYTPVGADEVGVSQRHGGKWDESSYRLETSDSSSVSVNDDHVTVSGLQIFLNYSENAVYGVGIGEGSAGIIRLENCIIRSLLSLVHSNVYGITIRSTAGATTVYANNNLVYDINGNGSNYCGISNWASGTTLYAYNNTVSDAIYGFRVATGTNVIKNNITQNCSSSGYIGTFFDTSSNYNISDISQADADNVNDTFDGYKTVQFQDAANDDFHLAETDTSARDAGTDLSSDPYLPFKVDIDGENRAYGDFWDIGADEATQTNVRIRGGVDIKGGVRIKKE